MVTVEQLMKWHGSGRRMAIIERDGTHLVEVLKLGEDRCSISWRGGVLINVPSRDLRVVVE